MPRPRQLAAFGLLAAAQAALAQSSPETGLAASVSASVNQVDTRRSNGADQRGLILQVRPGIVLNSRTGRLRGNLSYFANLQHDLASSRGDIAHNLDAAFTAEALENWFFVDGRASASRRPISAFGVQTNPSNPTRGNDNLQDLASASLRPYIRGVLGGAVSYNVGVYSSASRSSNATFGNVNERGGDFALSSVGGGLLGWGLNGSQQRVEFLSGRATVSDRVVASLNLRPDVDWFFTVRGGQESTDVASLDKRRYDNWGAGLRWTPSTRTVLSADLDKRYFGRSWSLVLEHRLAQSTFRLTSMRGASSSNTTGSYGGGITAYQLLFAQFASLQPDPVLRDFAVRDFLRQAGIDPTARVPGGSLTNAVTLQQRTDLSWTYTAARLTLSLQAFSGNTQILDTLAPRLGDGRVNQRGLFASAGWRLSATASANIGLSYLQTANNGVSRGNNLNSVSLGFSEQIGPRTTASVSARLSRQSGGPNPYRETAIGAAISHRF